MPITLPDQGIAFGHKGFAFLSSLSYIFLLFSQKSILSFPAAEPT
jgi:hypothetical protein